MNFLKLLIYFLLSFFILISCKPKEQQIPETFIQPGISKTLATHRAAQISTVNYELLFDIPANQSDTIQAKIQITLNLSEKTFPLILDLMDGQGEIHELKVNGKEGAFERKSDHLIIHSHQLKTGTNQLDISMSVGDLSLNRNEDYLYTLLVPARASSVFPCFDQPDLKASYDLQLKVPEQWSTVANGKILSVTNNEQEKTKNIKYTNTKAIPTYLFAFAAGKFNKMEKEIEGRKFTMYFRETDTAKVNCNAQQIFDLHAKAYNWLENYTDIPYPFESYEFLAIPSFQYGGMEHPGAIWYKASSLFLEKNPTRNQELSRAQLIAHEVAHMWFGDLVTMKWFNDVWLKEVFANFMADKITQPDFPDINHQLKFLFSHYPSAYHTDRSAGTHPIQQELNNLKDAGSLYGNIIYKKAPIVMKHLENRIGEKAMQNGLQNYLSKFQMGNATWDDLIAILSETSGNDLNQWNQDWIKSAGMPHFKTKEVSQDKELKELVIEQTADRIYQQDLNIAVVYQDTTDLYPLSSIKKESTINELKNSAIPEYINIFGSGYEYGYYSLNPEQTSWLLGKVNEEEEESRRFVYWMTLWENFLNENINPDDLLKSLIQSVQKEENPIILSYTLKKIPAIYWRFLNKEQKTNKISSLEKILWDRMKKEKNSSLKRQLWNSYKELASSKNGLNNLFKIWQKKIFIPNLPLSEKDYTSVAVNLCLREHPNWEQILKQQPNRIKNPDRKKEFEFITPALSNDPNERESFFNSIKNLENRNNESWVQKGIAYLHYPNRTNSSEKYLKETLDLLEELQQTGDIFFPGRVLENTFAWYSNANANQIVDQFLEENPNYPKKLKNKILQAADMMKRSLAIRKVYNIKN
ncbi:M1 family metallopeptidase [Xanthovirga aplysinae]|uniref:M1 family metallopeptidase n=1 Tax=Xanthovirga aplysinae TaxID=2529853 RepID=UPI0012BD0EDD|nr:M1 family aminopeptidase [Xanthovirga aplysinae]MTI32976.1 hypothetical protein [Xanthovirga aplysinae]